MRSRAVVLVLFLSVVLSCSTTPQSDSAHSDKSEPREYSDYDVIPLGDGVYQIQTPDAFASFRKLGQSLRLRAAEFTLASGRSHFRILDTWSVTSQLGAKKTILIRLTDDPNDISAEWVIANE